MPCSKSLDFATTGGAHLSFYWTMDEGGTADKVDSTTGLHWPLAGAASASPGLFVNGTHLSTTAFAGDGLALFNSLSLAYSAVTGKGISFWFWFKLSAFGTAYAQMDLFNHDTVTTDDSELNLAMTFDNVSGTVQLQHFDSGGVHNAFVVNTQNPTLGSWHMVAGTLDTVAHTLNLYYDGVLVATTPDAFTYSTTNEGDLQLRNAVAGAGNMNLVVDEFGLSLKGAATLAQIVSLFNAGAGKTWPNITSILPYP